LRVSRRVLPRLSRQCTGRRRRIASWLAAIYSFVARECRVGMAHHLPGGGHCPPCERTGARLDYRPTRRQVLAATAAIVAGGCTHAGRFGSASTTPTTPTLADI